MDARPAAACSCRDDLRATARATSATSAEGGGLAQAGWSPRSRPRSWPPPGRVPTTHLVPGQGHLLLAGDHAKDALQSALGGGHR